MGRLWSYLGGDPTVAKGLFACLNEMGERVVIAAGGAARGSVPVVAWGGESVPAWGHLQGVLASSEGPVVVFGDPDGPVAAALRSLHRVVVASRGAGAAGLVDAAGALAESAGSEAAPEPPGGAAPRGPRERGELLRSLAGGARPS